MVDFATMAGGEVAHPDLTLGVPPCIHDDAERLKLTEHRPSWGQE